ncbi:MAG: helix-turn-helix transcriptional regulator [Clostridia bacterium]|jgi:transcriptional regulator with XRE-family HTH domain|nr:helix-turn-helix transcriptional regulator [Clostridia bacterium]
MITLEKIQHKLAEAIKLSNIKQVELGKMVGVKHPQISCYLHGKKMPALDTFAKLMVALDADPAEILCLNEYEY